MIGAVVGASVLISVYLYGRHSGKTEIRNKILEDTLEAVERRKEIDQNVENISPYDLCVRVGGLPEQCDELRGVDETPKSQ